MEYRTGRSHPVHLRGVDRAQGSKPSGLQIASQTSHGRPRRSRFPLFLVFEAARCELVGSASCVKSAGHKPLLRSPTLSGRRFLFSGFFGSFLGQAIEAHSGARGTPRMFRGATVPRSTSLGVSTGFAIPLLQKLRIHPQSLYQFENSVKIDQHTWECCCRVASRLRD